MSIKQHFDIVYKVKGNQPVRGDHQHTFYAALSRLNPAFHSLENIQYTTVNLLDGSVQRFKEIGDRSNLIFRCSADNLDTILDITNRELLIGTAAVKLVSPSIRLTAPKRRLRSRLVIISKRMEQKEFRASVQRQLNRGGITCDFHIGNQLAFSLFKEERRITICGYEVVAYNFKTPEDSLKLQVQGLGGKRKFSCGVFI